jgi:hypothetical protein
LVHGEEEEVSRALAFLLATAGVLVGCSAQKPACRVVKLADDLCVMIETPDGQQVSVPAADLRMLAVAVSARSAAVASASSSSSPPPAAK